MEKSPSGARLTVYFDQISRHALDGEFFRDGAASLLAQIPRLLRVREQLVDGCSESLRILGIVKETSLRCMEEFRERGVAGLHDGNSAGECFDDVKSKGLAVKRGRGKNRERFEKIDFSRAIHVWKKRDIPRKASRLQPFLQGFNQHRVGRAAAPSHFQFQAGMSAPLFQCDEGIDHRLKTLFAAHPRKITKHRRRMV